MIISIVLKFFENLYKIFDGNLFDLVLAVIIVKFFMSEKSERNTLFD